MNAIRLVAFALCVVVGVALVAYTTLRVVRLNRWHRREMDRLRKWHETEKAAMDATIAQILDEMGLSESDLSELHTFGKRRPK